MALKTTTWKDRNIVNLELTKVFAVEKEIVNPSIIDFGPGGSVYFMADYLPEGRTADLPVSKKFIRVFESFLRKTGLFRLKTNEPKEIVRIFASLSPSKLAVFDREERVIKAVSNLAKNGEIDIPVDATVKDILDGPVNVQADIVIALNIISRTNDSERALKNIIAATRPGGIICINIDDPPKGFKKLGHCVFERLE